MNIKQATQLAIIGLIIQMAVSLFYALINWGLLSNNYYEYGKYINLLSLFAQIPLILFFFTLHKNQK